MHIKMLTSVVEDFSSLDEGQAYDLPPVRAKRLINLGKAEAIQSVVPGQVQEGSHRKGAKV